MISNFGAVKTLALTYVNMRWHVALYPRIRVDKPRTTNVTPSLEDFVLNDILHLREAMLKLVCHHQTGIAGANSDDTESSWSISQLVVHRYDILRYNIHFLLWSRSSVMSVQKAGLGLLVRWLFNDPIDSWNLAVRVGSWRDSHHHSSKVGARRSSDGASVGERWLDGNTVVVHAYKFAGRN